jgi:hypothetical protein
MRAGKLAQLLNVLSGTGVERWRLPFLWPGAYSGHREQRDRSIVNATIGDRDRSEATLSRSALELPLLSS